MADEPQNEVTFDAKNLTASVKSASLNTLATVATLLIVCAASAYGYSVASTHVVETKEASGALVNALRDQTQVMRESNCLQTYRGPEDQKSSFCKAVTR